MGGVGLTNLRNPLTFPWPPKLADEGNPKILSTSSATFDRARHPKPPPISAGCRTIKLDIGRSLMVVFLARGTETCGVFRSGLIAIGCTAFQRSLSTQCERWEWMRSPGVACSPRATGHDRAVVDINVGVFRLPGLKQ